MKARDIFSFFLGGATTEVIPRLLRGATSGGVDLLRAKFKKILQHSSQGELTKVLVQLQPEELEGLLFHFRKAKEDNREREFSMTLAAALPRKEDGSVELAEAKEILSQLSQADADVMDEIFESLAKNSLRHQIENELGMLSEVLEKALLQAAFAAGVTARAIKKVDEAAEKKANKIRETKFGKLSHHLFR